VLGDRKREINFGEQPHSITRRAPARNLELRRDGKAIYDEWLKQKLRALLPRACSFEREFG
jgi:hypothetical protein